MESRGFLLREQSVLSRPGKEKRWGRGGERAGPRLPWMRRGGKSLGPSGRRLGCLGVSMPDGRVGVSFPGTTSNSSSSVISALLSCVMTLCDKWYGGGKEKFLFFARVSRIHFWFIGPRPLRWPCLRRGLKTLKCLLPSLSDSSAGAVTPPQPPACSELRQARYLSLWSLVPLEEVGGEASLSSGLGCCQRKLPVPLWCLGWLGWRGKDGRKSCLQHHQQPTGTFHLPHPCPQRPLPPLLLG